jgi:phytoene/squalene synthetase
MAIQKALAHCRALVKQYDPQDYACSFFLPENLKPLKWALGALNVETARIKMVSHKPELCMARMQFWVDSLSTVSF